ncbi:MAG: SIR2 family protein, partial [Solirubrobacterales bacterium]
RGQCVAILGPELSDKLLGTRREIARRWAEEHDVPLILQDRDDLAQVAQYLAVIEGQSFPASTLVDHIERELRRKYAVADPALAHADIDRLIAAAGAAMRATDPLEPHRILARLPLSVYITASPGSLLTDALREAGREPRVVVAPWNDRVEVDPLPDDYEPSEHEPLVYYALGYFDNPSSLVITEDDFFEYLIGITSRRDDIPPMVNSATAASALLFLGFSPEDWTFRVMFSTIMSQQGQAAMNRFDHVAVQVSPDERRPDNPRGLRHYMETYFRNRVFQGRFSVYWGRATDFLGELIDRSPELRQNVLGPAAPDSAQPSDPPPSLAPEPGPPDQSRAVLPSTVSLPTVGRP